MLSKAVLITGVSNGIGKATSDLFLDHGWQVIGVDQNDISSPNILFFQGDVSQPSLWLLYGKK